MLGMEHWSHPYFQYAQAGECWTEFAARDRSTWHQPVVPAEVACDAETHDEFQARLIRKVARWIVKSVVVLMAVLVGGLLHLVLQWVFGASPWWQWPIWGFALLFIGVVVSWKDSKPAQDEHERA